MNARPYLANGVHIAFFPGGGADGVEANSVNLPGGKVPAVILTESGALSLGCNCRRLPAGRRGRPGDHRARHLLLRPEGGERRSPGAAALGVVNNAAGFFSPLLTNVTIHSSNCRSRTPPPSWRCRRRPPPRSLRRMCPMRHSNSPPPSVPADPGRGWSVETQCHGAGRERLLGQYRHRQRRHLRFGHLHGHAACRRCGGARDSGPQGLEEPGLRAAVIETASPTALPDYSPRIEGSGLVQAAGATATEVTVHGEEDRKMGLLSFGVAELTREFRDERDLIVVNHDAFPRHSRGPRPPREACRTRSGCRVRPCLCAGRDETVLRMSLAVPAKTAGVTHDASNNSSRSRTPPASSG